MPDNPDESFLPPYDAIADLYDLEHRDFDDDISMLRSIAGIVGDPIIEFGCGSGRVLIPLANDGFDVTGVDTSVAMLDRARSSTNAMPEGGSVTLQHGDVSTRLPFPPERFGVAIFSLNGMMHLTTQQDQLAALREACRLLDPRGQLVIDLFNPTPDYLTQLGSGPHFEGAWRSDSGTEIEKWSHRTVRAATQTIDTRLWYDTVHADGALHRIRTSFILRYLHAAELELMLERAGFVEWQLYGSYDLDPYTDTSDRLIVLAERTPS